MRPFPVSVSLPCISRLLVLCCCVLLYACAPQTPTYIVQVNALAADTPAPAAMRYILLPLEATANPNDLEYKGYAGQVQAALTQRGFTLVETIKEADAAVLLDYGISDPKEETVTYTSPVYEPIGFASTSRYVRYNHRRGYYTNRAYYAPVYGVTAYTTQTHIKLSYTRTLSLLAVELKHGKKTEHGKQLWSVQAVSTGANGDLRAVFPALVTAVKNYIATDSVHSVTIKVDANNPTQNLVSE